MTHSTSWATAAWKTWTHPILELSPLTHCSAWDRQLAVTLIMIELKTHTNAHQERPTWLKVTPISHGEAACDEGEFMKTSVWCFIRADSHVMWIFKAHSHCQRPLWLSLSVMESYKGKRDGQRRTKVTRSYGTENLTLFFRELRRNTNGIFSLSSLLPISLQSPSIYMFYLYLYFFIYPLFNLFVSARSKSVFLERLENAITHLQIQTGSQQYTVYKNKWRLEEEKKATLGKMGKRISSSFTAGFFILGYKEKAHSPRSII